MNVATITIGDEILIGQIVDTNAAWIGSKLVELGLSTTIKITIGDSNEEITKALEHAFAQADVVLMTGGLGPTKDDTTKKALTQYFKCESVFSQSTYDNIVKIFSKRGIPLKSAHKEQCYLPEIATLLENKMGTAPGMWFEKDGKYLCSMPGVPFEMKYIMTHGVLPRLRTLSQHYYEQITLKTSGIGESSLADLVESSLIKFSDVKIAYLPSVGGVRLRLSVQGGSGAQQKLSTTLTEAKEALVSNIASHVYGYDEDTLEGHIGELLLEKKLMLGTAESCTGGYIAHLITSVAGSSRYFKGSTIAYSNDVKISHLNVKPATIELHGAVSEQTVVEMVRGAIQNIPCDVGIAVSGICGPGGGSRDKPVGTVWMATGDKHTVWTKKHLFTKDRALNIKYTGIYALDLLRKFLSTR